MVSVMLYPCIVCVALLIDIFILYVACMIKWYIYSIYYLPFLASADVIL